MTPDCHLLFVYGTLRRHSGHHMAQWLTERAKYVGESIIAGRLYDVGQYPGLVDAVEPDDRVHGELYDLDGDAPATLAELDRYEGADQPTPLFERRITETIGADGTGRPAWVYWYRGPVQAERRIASGRHR